MIKKVVIKELFHSKIPTTLIMNDKLFILTGDNGAGKTTILNMIYYSLNGNFDWLYKVHFKSIKLLFQRNKINLDYLLICRERDGIEVEYKFGDSRTMINVYKGNRAGNVLFHLVDLEKDNINTTEEISRNNPKKRDLLFFAEDRDKILIESIDDLIENSPSLHFINDIRKSLLYFPTYRRIDNDIKNLLENNINKNIRFYREIDFVESLIDLIKDRRVIGVGDEDIEGIYKEYSDELREFNSEGLNELLKEFVKSVIESLYSSTESKKNEFDDLKIFEKAPQHLLDLADKLDIKSIEQDQVYLHYDRMKSNREKITSLIKDQKIMGRQSLQFEVESEMLQDLIGNYLFDYVNDNNIVNQLIQLYVEHLNEQEKKLEQYYYLESGFQLFFKNKLGIELNSKNYNITLSKPFSELSTGEKQLITIISYSALAIRNGSFNPLIIIDEPEISLHVSWQGKLIGHLLKNNNSNLLLATHSPFIAKTEYFQCIHQLGDIDENY